MKVVLQRSLHSKVLVDETSVGEIDSGLVLFVCCEKNDTEAIVLKAAEKIKKLRIFTDPETGKMNFDINQAKGSYLVVSQFTLSWEGTKGNRPSFDNSMDPEPAEELFNKFCDCLSRTAKVNTGQFGASMKVCIENDGPVTFSFSF
ncbi:MAG: D-tyrosyl-tRNA(Tyr) deacylase [Bacteriovoracaceae bacterium]|jgi:D-tyrosyl-tRNA(Tyr) deacylase